MPGVCRLGDKARAEIDVHGCPACPHTVVGPAISASSNVFVNGLPALRLGDIGMHAACCGPNTWTVIEASGKVFVNGSSMVRKGDLTQHCGGFGKMIEASGNVNDNSPLMRANPFMPLPPLPPLPMNEVLVFPSAEPFCPTPAGLAQTPGLPLTGGPQIYDPNAAAAAQAANLPHADALAPGQRVADAQHDIALVQSFGAQPNPTDHSFGAQSYGDDLATRHSPPPSRRTGPAARRSGPGRSPWWARRPSNPARPGDRPGPISRFSMTRSSALVTPSGRSTPHRPHITHSSPARRVTHRRERRLSSDLQTHRRPTMWREPTLDQR